jgi:hypothetical protein
MILLRNRFSQNANDIFLRISALASNMRSNQKKGTSYHDHCIGGFYFDSLTLLFLFDLFLEARAEILKKLRWYLGETMFS